MKKQIPEILIILGLVAFWSCEEATKPDTTAPTVVITSPVEDATLSSATTIRVDATDDSGVEKVEFLIDGEVIGTDTEEPWEHLWQVSYYADGETHSILAKATDEVENIGQSDLVRVFVSENAQETPQLISPANGEIFRDTTVVNLTWSSIAGAEEYIVLVSSNSEFTDTEYSITTSDTTVTTDALADGYHYWKVRAKNSVGNYGEWSDVSSFRIVDWILGELTDQDGNTYQTIQIGNQEWMMENLKVTHYRDGTAIPTGHSNSEWENLSTGAYAVYNDDVSNADTYGYLYNWYAVDDSRNIAPEGWHVPTDDEWQILVDYLGGSSVAGGKMKETGTEHWNSPNTGATNESGFSARPGGYRNYYDGYYYYMGDGGGFRSSTENNSSTAWHRSLNYNNSGVFRAYSSKDTGFSVRCIRD